MAESTFKVDGGIEAVGVVTGTSFKRVGGSSVEFLKADGSVDVGTYKTTDTNTTYSISAADHTANKKLLRLNDGSSNNDIILACLLYTSPSPRDRTRSRMPSSA